MVWEVAFRGLRRDPQREAVVACFRNYALPRFVFQSSSFIAEAAGISSENPNTLSSTTDIRRAPGPYSGSVGLGPSFFGELLALPCTYAHLNISYLSSLVAPGVAGCLYRQMWCPGWPNKCRLSSLPSET